jgi:hypothetical protein
VPSHLRSNTPAPGSRCVRSILSTMHTLTRSKENRWTVCRAALTVYLVFPLSASCARHRPTHVAADESRPHITWEIRSGGDLGDDLLVCGSPEPTRKCVLGASSERDDRPVTVHLYLHSSAHQTSYLGIMHVPFLQGAEGQNGHDVSATVPTGSQPVGVTVTGLVMPKAGDYTFSISLDAKEAGIAATAPIRHKASVLVKRGLDD